MSFELIDTVAGLQNVTPSLERGKSRIVMYGAFEREFGINFATRAGMDARGWFDKSYGKKPKNKTNEKSRQARAGKNS